jgi:hypothetical protein
MMPAPTSHPAAPSGPELRDIHLPPSPSWWPPAPGWWLLAGLLALALGVAAWLWLRRRRMRQRVRQVMLEVEQLVLRHRRDGDTAALVAGLHQLLRRAARRHDARAAWQRGEAWRQTLARMPVDDAVLEQLLALDEAIYRPPSSFDDVAAVMAVRQWLALALKPSAWKPAAPEHAHA